MPPASLYEQGSGSGAQPADQRPVSDFRLGDKACRTNRLNDEYVQPGDVIEASTQPAPPSGQHAIDINANVENRQQLPDPATDIVLLGRVTVREISSGRLLNRAANEAADE
jgi:hypothetical protein